MPVITLFSASYCRGDEVADEVARGLGYERIDREVLQWASEQFDISVQKLVRAMRGAPSVFDKFSHERDRCVAYIKAAIGEKLKGDNVVYIAADTTAERRVVQTGFRSDEQTEILSGLTLGESVVVQGQRSLKDGQPLKILERLTFESAEEEQAGS